MLTNVFYYDVYRPYILSNRESSTFAPKRGRIADRREKTAAELSGQAYILNKSLKDEIVQYAQNVSQGTTHLHSTTRQVAAGMENFNRDGADSTRARQRLTGDLGEFTEQYNGTIAFMKEQPHSAELRAFSDEISDTLRYNRDRLALLGFSQSDEGTLSFDRLRFSELSRDQANVAIGENIQIFSDLHAQTNRLLQAPLAEHMRFKGLSYHYNYKMGAMVADDGFSLIESGMIIDTSL